VPESIKRAIEENSPILGLDNHVYNHLPIVEAIAELSINDQRDLWDEKDPMVGSWLRETSEDVNFEHSERFDISRNSDGQLVRKASGTITTLKWEQESGEYKGNDSTDRGVYHYSCFQDVGRPYVMQHQEWLELDSPSQVSQLEYNIYQDAKTTYDRALRTGRLLSHPPQNYQLEALWIEDKGSMMSICRMLALSLFKMPNDAVRMRCWPSISAPASAQDEHDGSAGGYDWTDTDWSEHYESH